jgi:AraC-like DNA-binding protein
VDEWLSHCQDSTVPSTTTVPAIGEALRYVQMSGIFYCPTELSEPWGLSLPAMDTCVWFHAVIEGTFTVDVEGQQRIIRPGDLVVVPHGTGHSAWGLAETETQSVLDLPHDEVNEHYAVLRHGGGGALTHVICGGIRFEHPAARQLVAALPSIIHIESSRSSRSSWLRSTLELLAEETRDPKPGGEAVVSRLCDIVVIQAIRSWIETDPAAQTGWLGALRDEQVGAAMAMIHAAPERDWSVAALADAVAMSRSAFSARFTELVGEPAMKYVTRWRMHIALDLMQHRGLTVASTASSVGYDSEAAFSRAFTRVMGKSPRAARAAAAQEPSPTTS